MIEGDNNWHDGVVCKCVDGNFILDDSLQNALSRHRERLTGEYQKVRYNWNGGEPVVDFGDFQMNIKGITFSKAE